RTANSNQRGTAAYTWRKPARTSSCSERWAAHCIFGFKNRVELARRDSESRNGRGQSDTAWIRTGYGIGRMGFQRSGCCEWNFESLVTLALSATETSELKSRFLP